MFQKKNKGEARTTEKLDLHPVSHVADCILDYQKYLVKQEVESLDAMAAVQHTFEIAQGENKNLRDQLEGLSEAFVNVGQVADEFNQVRSEIAASVGAAQKSVNELKDSSAEVQAQFGEIQEAFSGVQVSVQEIKDRMQQISAIAKQTNILALNASIEAARAGEQGRGFAVVAQQVGSLANEIKNLINMVGNSISDVENGTVLLDTHIEDSKSAIGQNVEKVDAAYTAFDQIIGAADGAKDVQQEIQHVVNQSEQQLLQVRDSFAEEERQFAEALSHISRANELGTTKSSTFEDLANLVAQLSPLAEELEQQMEVVRKEEA